MRRVMLVLLLATVSGSAMAELTMFGHDDHSTGYIDKAGAHRSGSKVKMSGLYDFKTVQQPNYLSMKYQMEYDCKLKQLRELSYHYYSGNMGAGEMVHAVTKTGKWLPVAPGSINDTLWKYACSKK